MSELFINYKKCLEKYGEPSEGAQLSPQLIESYRGRIPETYLDFLSKYGTGKWLKGYFQLCSPREYNSIISFVFDGDKDFTAGETYAIGFSAFGEILAWNEKHRVVRVDLLYHRVDCPDLFKPKPSISPDISLGGAIGGASDEAFDLPDQKGDPMFKRALKLHGELEVGQIYSPKLHPALGGPITVDNLRPANAVAAMAIAAQAGAFTLYDTTKPGVPAVRRIGE